ncbi:winged helix-turn-helix domain-containing protein [Acinetobacter pittii]|uniref:winged helix-turn-helix domain-containing protein n=1 Tax=Acinetobacter pittii TaxID=48296 RepID=UPI001ABF7FB5|nr:winged helix-turn-helix domain-containing protein [Acinetobacter pittii]QDB82638.1 winged helix-turn-helix domain-containing protein [Acinetobacter pittii]
MSNLTNPAHIEIFIRFIAVIKAVNTLRVATRSEINKTALPNLSSRSAQRYLSELVDEGYLRFVGNPRSEYRYFITDKAREVFQSLLKSGGNDA